VHDLDVDPRLARQPRQHPAVAAVVAATAGDQHVLLFRPARAQPAPGGRTRAAHQGRALIAEGGDRARVDRSHLRGGEQGHRGRHVPI
jgi:hypothetical protein